MADQESREVKFEVDGGKPFSTGGDTKPIVAEPVKSGELTMKINVDVSDALTALKAVERKAREAKRTVASIYDGTSEYRPIRVSSFLGDNAINVKINLSTVSTADLVSELGRREGVVAYEVGQGRAGSVTTGNPHTSPYIVSGGGKIVIIEEDAE